MRKLQLIAILFCLGFAPASVFAQKIIKESINSEGKEKNELTTSTFRQAVSRQPQLQIVLLQGSNRNGLTLVENGKRSQTRKE